MVVAFIGPKTSVACLVNLWVNQPANWLNSAETARLGTGRVWGTLGVGVNPVILRGPPVAKAPHWNGSDGQGRSLGARTGLDTRVVLGVNAVNLVSGIRNGFSVPE